MLAEFLGNEMGPFVRNEQFLHENDFLLLFSTVKGCKTGTVFWNFATVFLDFGTVKNVCNCKLRNCIFYDAQMLD